MNNFNFKKLNNDDIRLHVKNQIHETKHWLDKCPLSIRTTFKVLDDLEKAIVLNYGLYYHLNSHKKMDTDIENEILKQKSEEMLVLKNEVEDKENEIKKLKIKVKNIEKSMNNELELTKTEYNNIIKNKNIQHLNDINQQQMEHKNRMKSAECEKENEIKQIKKSYSQKIEDVKEKAEIDSHNQIALYKKELENKYNNEIEKIKTENTNLKTDLRTAEKKVNTIEVELRKEFQNKCDRIRDKYDAKCNEQNNRLKDIQESLHAKALRNENSAKKGMDGELTTLNVLNDTFNCMGGYVKDVHNESGKGDYMIEFNKNNFCDKPHNIMIDSKNFSEGHTIPKRDIDKFKKDIITNSQYDGGILVTIKKNKIHKKVYPLDWEILKIPDTETHKVLVYAVGIVNKPELIMYAYTIISKFIGNEKLIINKEKNDKLKEDFKTMFNSLNTQTNDLNKYVKQTKESIKKQKAMLKLIIESISID
tara:strand:- start:545 stop:1975 length:1431 start_codon:yes stop_codon:yes gene_type:complete